MSRWTRLALRLLAVGVLLAVFMLYLRPDFMVTMSDFEWSCTVLPNSR